MRSVALDFAGRRLEQGDVPEPAIEHPADVLFRVHEVGICGTDRELVAFRLGRPRDRNSHLVIGHEGLGQVLEAGPAAGGFDRGDWVVPMIRRPCSPLCRSCARLRPDLCLTSKYTERGIFGADGYFTELAVDNARDLVRVPERLVPFAILVEPLSVVEKAIGRAIAIRQVEENSALVLGLGPVGMLAALVLQARGYDVRVHSLEPEDHPRVRLMETHGIRYSRKLDGQADIIVEAAGDARLALAALSRLAPAGIFVTLGAQQGEGTISFIDLIVGNQTIIGSVNASRDSFEAALAELDVLPASALKAMIRRFDFGDYRQTLFGHPGAEAKFVHVI